MIYLNYILEHPYLKFLLFITIFIILLIPLNKLIFSVFKRIWNDSLTEVKFKYKKLKAALIWFIASIFILVIQSYLPFPDKINLSLNKIISINLIISLSILSIKILHLIKDTIYQNLKIDTTDNLKARKAATQIRIFEKFIIALIILIAISTSLMLFDQVKKLGVNILASAGLAGIIVGFAAQKSIATVLAGVQIAFTQPIRIDDVVIIEGEWGWIEEINLTYVVVKIWDLRRLVVPINHFIDKPFQNWTRTNSEILGSVFLYLDYHAPIDEIRSELTKILNSTDLWDGKTNVLQVTNSSEKTIEIRALMSAKDSPTAWNLRVLVREKLISFMQKNHPTNLPKIRIEKA